MGHFIKRTGCGILKRVNQGGYKEDPVAALSSCIEIHDDSRRYQPKPSPKDTGLCACVCVDDRGRDNNF